MVGPDSNMGCRGISTAGQVRKPSGCDIRSVYFAAAQAPGPGLPAQPMQHYRTQRLRSSWLI